MRNRDAGDDCFLFPQHQVQQYLRVKETSSSTTTKPPDVTSKPLSIEYYTIPLPDDHIVFVDSMASYERLLARLFRNDQDNLVIGFDCNQQSEN